MNSVTFSPAPKPVSPPKQPKGMNKQNRARLAGSFARAYGSKARVKFVNLQPCAACGVWGYSQNAHVLGNDGASRKAHYTTIAPLCGPRPSGVLLHEESGLIYEGCHSLFDTAPEKFRARFAFNPKRAARECHRKWMAFVNGASI